jgi:integrase/recombinase XerD
MSDKPISPLRRRMIEDMTVRNFVEKTRNDYSSPNSGHS